MNNYKQPGAYLTLTAPAGGVVGGAPILVGGLFGVVAADALAGDQFVLATEGVFELPGPAATEGQRLYWTAAGAISTTATGNTLIGHAARASAGGTVELRLSN